MDPMHITCVGSCMKLPSHLLTKLCLVGAVGVVGTAIGCEQASRDTPHMQIVDEPADPVTVEVGPVIEEPVRVPSYSQPPGAAPKFAPKPPPPIQIKKPKPKAQPVVSHVCGPCGMG